MNRESDCHRSEHLIKNSLSHKRMYWLYMSSLIGGLVMLLVALVAKGEYLQQPSFDDYLNPGAEVTIVKATASRVMSNAQMHTRQR